MKTMLKQLLQAILYLPLIIISIYATNIKYIFPNPCDNLFSSGGGDFDKKRKQECEEGRRKAAKSQEEWKKKLFTPLKINFTKNDIKKVYDKWGKFNTGTYVYVCRSSTIRGGDVIFFIKNNYVVKYAVLPYSIKKAFKVKVMKADSVESKDTVLYRRRATRWAKDINFYLIDNRFEKALSDLNNPEWYDCYEFNINFDTEFPYISTLWLKEVGKYPQCKSRPARLHTHGWSISSYGLMMLPKETEFTNNLVNDILKKYEHVWECTRKVFLSDGDDEIYSTLWDCYQ